MSNFDIKLPRPMSPGESVAHYMEGLLPNARKMFDQISEQISEFQESLDDEHDLAVQLIGLPTSIQITHFSYLEPGLFVFEGFINSDELVRLIQSISQLNFLLIAVRRPDSKLPKRKIGFSFDSGSE